MWKQTRCYNNNNNQQNDSSDHDDDDDDNPLILNSLADLMEAAGEELPDKSTPINDDTKMVEANIEFAVMTQDEYNTKLSTLKHEQEMERQELLKVFMGKQDIFGDDDVGNDSTDDDIINNDDDGGDDDNSSSSEMMMVMI